MPESPFFSIITPVYNRADLVGETIDSVLAQDFTDFELILIDDGSSDNSVQILEEYAKKDQRIKCILLPQNFGRCLARNEGLKNARGKWICHLDSDDTFYSNHLSHFFTAIHENPDFKAFSVNQHLNNILVFDRNKDLEKEKVVWNIERFVADNPLTANQLCYSSELSLQWAQERIPISEDWLFLRILVLKTPILKFSIVTVNLRDHENRTVNIHNEKGVDEFVKWNLYTANKFVSENTVSTKIKNRILAHTLLLCSNVYLSTNLKNKARPLFRDSMKYLSSYRYLLFYTAIFKFLKQINCNQLKMIV
jgi:glycosyltransferase involved in cell wall biosynthesis